MNKNQYIKHIINSIENSEFEISKLNKDILNMPGMSRPKNRHLMNNLAGFIGCNYLEVGLYKGSTFCSSLYNNLDLINSAIGIDNYSEFQDMEHVLEGNSDPTISIKDQFYRNYNNFIGNSEKVTIYNVDAFSFNLNILKNKINLYFYDGEHSFDSQRRAYHYFNNALDDTFITVVDDWECSSGGPRNGTIQAFKDLNYNVLYHHELPKGEYHQGLLIALISKKN